jgi:hypothetical protein
MAHRPGATEGGVNSPASLVLMERVPWAWISSSTTPALGTAAPLGSTITPEMEPSPPWLEAVPEMSRTSGRHLRIGCMSLLLT